jgi:MFS family permease
MSATFGAFHAYPLFRRLWIASFGYTLSQWMQNIALGWLAYEITDSERFVGLIAFAAGCPFIVVSIPGGALLDRYDRRTVLLISQALAAFVAIGMATVVLSGVVEPWHLLVGAFLNGSLQAIITPSQQSIVPRLVSREDLQNALGLMSAGGNLTRVFGPAMAGVIISTLGTGYPFLLQAIAVSVSFLVIFLSAFPRVPPATNRLGLRVISEGSRIILGRPDLRELFLLSAFPSLLIFPYLSFLNVYAEDILDIGSRGLGLLLASSGVGAVVGGLLIASRASSSGMGRQLYRLTFLYCAVMVVFAAVPNLLVVLPMLAIAGFVGSYAFAGNNALVQGRIDDEVRGRVMGTYLLTWGLMPVGSLWMGEVAELFDVRVATLSGASICLIATLLLRLKSQELHSI